MTRPSLLVATLFAVEAVAWSPLAAFAQDPGSRFAGIRFQLVEDAHDGRFVVPPDQRVQVDANAGLALTFHAPVRPEDVAESPEGSRLAALLEQIGVLADSVQKLNLALDLGDTARQRVLRQAAIDLDGDIMTLLFQDLQRVGLAERDIGAVLAGRFPGGSGNPEEAYSNLGRWLKLRIESLTREAEAFAARSERIRVQVQAFRDPAAGRRSAIHVDNYDRLPEGQLSEIDRFGLRLTDAEAERFETSLKNNQLIAASLDELISKRSTIAKQIRTLLEDVEKRVARLARTIEEAPANLPEQFDGALVELGRISQAAESPAETKTSAAELQDAVRHFQADFQAVGTLLEALTGLASELKNPSSTDLTALLSPKGPLVGKVAQAQTALATLMAAVPSWGPRLTRVKDLAATLGARLGAESSTRLLQKSLDPFFRSVNLELPKTFEALGTLLDYFKLNRDATGLLDGPAAADVGILHSPDDLPDGRIDLRRVGWALGDHLTIYVRFLESAGRSTDPDSMRVAYEAVYDLEALLTGLHREVSSTVTFARAVSGDADAVKWKPNVAALVSWHHHVRNARGFGSVWNFVDPGLGLHLASLDQTDDNVEFGLGLNLSFWKNLLTGGYGYNLSRETKGSYWFVGLDLFEILNRSLR